MPRRNTPDPLAKRVGARVRQLRQEAGLTIEKILAVGQPTLALYGEYSPFLSTANYLVEHLQNCRSVLVPNARHRAPEENPGEFTRLLVDWVGTLARAGAQIQEVAG